MYIIKVASVNTALEQRLYKATACFFLNLILFIYFLRLK